MDNGYTSLFNLLVNVLSVQPPTKLLSAFSGGG